MANQCKSEEMEDGIKVNSPPNYVVSLGSECNTIT
jgi:hypothetical protein